MENLPAKTPEKELCEALYNHLVLPPQLPHREDANVEGLETALLDRLILSAQKMREVTEQKDFQAA